MSPSVIGSPASADGPMPSSSPAGQSSDPSGPRVYPVSRFRGRDADKAMRTEDISGPLFTASSPSASLQSCLGNRLRHLLDANGSPEYALTWKTWDMPSGLPICALRASARRTSASGCSGWPTPMAGAPGTDTYNPAGNTDSSRKTVALAGWPTPNAIPECRGGLQSNPEKALERRQHGHMLNLDDAAVLAGWPTSNAQDGPHGRPSQGTNQLPAAAALAGWATPNAMDFLPCSNLTSRKTRGGCVNLKDQAPLASGPPPTSSPVSTEKRGALNPAFSRWLMGFPPEWDDSVPTGTRSSRRSERSS